MMMTFDYVTWRDPSLRCYWVAIVGHGDILRRQNIGNVNPVHSNYVSVNQLTGHDFDPYSLAGILYNSPVEKWKPHSNPQ